jgi:hypothetical protein
MAAVKITIRWKSIYEINDEQWALVFFLSLKLKMKEWHGYGTSWTIDWLRWILWLKWMAWLYVMSFTKTTKEKEGSE